MIYEPLFELEKNGINIKYHTNQENTHRLTGMEQLN